MTEICPFCGQPEPRPADQMFRPESTAPLHTISATGPIGHFSLSFTHDEWLDRSPVARGRLQAAMDFVKQAAGLQ